MTDNEIKTLAIRHCLLATNGQVIAFARAIAAAENEACAKVCDGFDYTYTGEHIAQAIRARQGEKHGS